MTEEKNEKVFCVRCEMNKVSGKGEMCWFCELEQQRPASGDQMVSDETVRNGERIVEEFRKNGSTMFDKKPVRDSRP